MARDVNATHTINHAAISPVVTNAAVGGVELSCKNDVCFHKEIDTSRALWYKRGLNSG